MLNLKAGSDLASGSGRYLSGWHVAVHVYETLADSTAAGRGQFTSLKQAITWKELVPQSVLRVAALRSPSPTSPKCLAEPPDHRTDAEAPHRVVPHRVAQRARDKRHAMLLAVAEREWVRVTTGRRESGESCRRRRKGNPRFLCTNTHPPHRLFRLGLTASYDWLDPIEPHTRASH